MVLAALLPEEFPLNEFKALIGLEESKVTGLDQNPSGKLEKPPKRAYNHNLTQEKVLRLKKIYREDGGVDRPLILDPFSGAGSIPFESLKMGCDVLSGDYSPLACLIQEATIGYPARYGKKLWLDLDETFKSIIGEAFNSLKEFYPQNNGLDVATYLHAWVVQCPVCGFRNPLVSQWWLAKRRKKRIYLDYTIHKDQIKFTIKTEGNPPQGNISGGQAHCLKCEKTLTSDYILREIMQNEEEMLLATVTLGENGKKYSLPTSEDLKALEKAREISKDIDDYIHIQDLLPLDEIPDDIRGKHNVKPYLKYWHKLLNPRQKILFSNLIESIKEYSDAKNNTLKNNNSKNTESKNTDSKNSASKKEEITYTKAVLTYLSFMVGKHINRNCRSTRYNRKLEKITGTVSQSGIPLLWDHTEINPFITSSGSLVVVKDEILKGLEYSENSILKSSNILKSSIHNPGAGGLKSSIHNHGTGGLEIRNESILQSSFKSPLIVTHIPYRDDVQYAEMSDFFYVFERSALNLFTDLPSESPKTEDLSISGIRSTEYFNYLFQESLQKLHSMLTDEGLLVLYFQPENFKSWEHLLNVLLESGFKITALWPIHTHQPRNPILTDFASFKSSLIVVARKNNVNRERNDNNNCEIFSIENLIKRVDSKSLESRIQGFWDYGLRGTDLTISLAGYILNQIDHFPVEIPSIDRLTQGEFSLKNENMNLDDLLTVTQQKIVQWVLNQFATDYEDMDAPTRFYLFCRLCGLDEMSMDVANLILKTLNLDLADIKRTGFIKVIKSGRRKGLKILQFHERRDITIEYQIDAAHIALNLYEMVGISKVQSFLKKNPDKNYVNIISTLSKIGFDDLEQELADGILNSRDIEEKSIRDSLI
jgi:putative DNA methylase